MKTSKLWQISISVFAITSLSCGMYFYHQKHTLGKMSQQADELLSLQDKKLSTLVEAYKLKHSFVKNLILNEKKQKSKTHQQILHTLENILQAQETLKIQNQSEFDTFEMYNNQLGQILVIEINKFSMNQASLFSDLSQVRNVERFDRHIDIVRANYSHWSFQYHTLKSSAEKNLFSKKAFNEVLYFKVDHLILNKKDPQHLSRSAAL